MTILEFSDQFDVLYNNITSNQAPGLNEYEKSLFLTKAEKEIVKNYFSPNSVGNTLKQGFDDSAKRQADFSVLMKTSKCTFVSDFGVPQYAFYTLNGQGKKVGIVYPKNVVFTKHQATGTIVPSEGTYNSATLTSGYGFNINGNICEVKGDGLPTITADTKLDVVEVDRIDPRSAVYSFPTDSYIIINESLYKKNKNILQVVPLRFDEYTRFMSKPFKRPLKNQAWRLTNSGEVSGSKSEATKNVEIIVNSWDEKAVDAYSVRYVRVPKPIIVATLDDDLSIDGESAQSTQCEIDPILHEDILQRAVELAKIAWTATGQDNAQMVLQAGQRSE